LPSIFIFGFLPYSSGKTVVACAVARGLANHGYSVGAFKPRSGHNFWYQYEAVYKGLEGGHLFCEDIMKLRAASRCQLPLEILNPVDALMSPINVESFLERRQLDRLYLIQRDMFAHLVGERYTILRNGKQELTLCLNEENICSGLILFDIKFLRSLKSSVNKIIPVKSLSEWNEVFQTLGPLAMQSCYREIVDKSEYVIVEGFNDAVCPDKSLRYNLVIGVAPGLAIFYNAEKFHQRLYTLEKLGKDPITLKSEDIVKYLKKERILKIPPLTKQILDDYESLSQKLEEIVNLTIDELTHVSAGV
jgi:predicted P-loop ATPase/GTPase